MNDFAGMRLEALGEPGELARGIDGLLGVDVEDCYQILLRRYGRGPRLCRVEFRRGLAALLDVLAHHGSKATFFVLGMTAAEDPSLVSDLKSAGHEIASHGFAHMHLERLAPGAFIEDLRRAISELTAMTGEPVVGYRAPEFSVPRHDPAVFFRTLVGMGIRYDASVFPIRGGRYGLAGFPRTPTRVYVESGHLIELPAATARWAGRTWPIAGGGHWRMTPKWALRWLAARARREGVLLTLYLHNYEFDPCKMDLAAVAATGELAPGWRSFLLKQNLFRRSIKGKLGDLMGRHRFAAFGEFLTKAGWLAPG